MNDDEKQQLNWICDIDSKIRTYQEVIDLIIEDVGLHEVYEYIVGRILHG